MSVELHIAVPILILCNILPLCAQQSDAQSGAPALTQLCAPKVIASWTVASAKERYEAGQKAKPPLTDQNNGFAWPDTPIGVIKTDDGYEFFASDGALHSRELWQGHWYGNNKYGSATRTVGTLDNPLGSGAPIDVTILPNPDPGVNPYYSPPTIPV
jgi:hypothetical protein